MRAIDRAGRSDLFDDGIKPFSDVDRGHQGRGCLRTWQPIENSRPGDRRAGGGRPLFGPTPRQADPRHHPQCRIRVAVAFDVDHPLVETSVEYYRPSAVSTPRPRSVSPVRLNNQPAMAWDLPNISASAIPSSGSLLVPPCLRSHQALSRSGARRSLMGRGHPRNFVFIDDERLFHFGISDFQVHSSESLNRPRQGSGRFSSKGKRRRCHRSKNASCLWWLRSKPVKMRLRPGWAWRRTVQIQTFEKAGLSAGARSQELAGSGHSSRPLP